LSSYRDEIGYCIRRAPHLPETLREGALALLETLPDEKTLCHGDFHPGNVIISPRGPVVIDWMTARSGSPWADVARTSLLLTIGVKGAGKMVNPAIRLLIGIFHQTYLNHYLALVPQGQADLQRWKPVIAAARLNEQIEPEREALVQIVKDGLNLSAKGIFPDRTRPNQR
jgi:aminoglycoside phosphotransferase (APT) family kinase protein